MDHIKCLLENMVKLCTHYPLNDTTWPLKINNRFRELPGMEAFIIMCRNKSSEI